MCEPTTIIMAVGATLSAASAIQQGRQAKATGDYQAAQAEADAKAAQGTAELQARAIRDAGKRQRSAAVAAQAAAGIDVGSGTAEVINRQITEDSEYDALSAIFEGKTRGQQLGAQAQGYRIAGRNAQTAGYLNAGSTALYAGAQLGGGWKNPVVNSPGLTTGDFARMDRRGY